LVFKRLAEASAGADGALRGDIDEGADGVEPSVGLVKV